jgi:hypothetical protein
MNTFPIWKTIKLGTGLKVADDFREALKAAGCHFGDWGNEILGKPAFTVSETEMEIDLVNVSVAELGFKGGTTFKKICDRAAELGLKLCPAEVGPQLRLQYVDKPKGEWFLIAMEPITDSEDVLRVFYIAHDGDVLYLTGRHGHPGRFCCGFHRFVFLRSK